MTRQTIFTGTTANDGTGDSLRTAANKINANFQDIYDTFGANDVLFFGLQFDSDSILFDGATKNNGIRTKLQAVDPTVNRIVDIPDASGTLVLETHTQTLTNKTLTTPVVTTLTIKDTSADHNYVIGVSELAANRTATLPLLAADDEFVFREHIQTLTNKQLDSANIQNPLFVGKFRDVNDNFSLELDPVLNAVNYVQIRNSNVGNPVDITADGDDTNIPLRLYGKGSAPVELTNRVSLDDGGAAITNDGGNILSTVPLHIQNKAALPNGKALANGSNNGELKRIINQGAATLTVTPTSFANGSSFTLAQHGVADLIWNGIAGQWHLINDGSSYITVS